MRKLEQNIKETYATKQEQVDASVRFVLHDNADYYDSLRNLPNRVNACVLKMVDEWPILSGYHFNVIRAGLRQYRTSGTITSDEPPFIWYHHFD